MTSHRRFHMNRTLDVTGTSGTGTVAEGIEFTSGRCVIEWTCEPASSICIYNSIGELLKIHGHDGATTVEWLDEADRLVPVNDESEMCRNGLHELPYTPDGEYPEYDGCWDCDDLTKYGLIHDEVTKAAQLVHDEGITLDEAIDRIKAEQI